MKMADLDLNDPTSLSQGSVTGGDTFPLANTDSTTESGDSFITQVPGEYSPSPRTRPTELRYQDATPLLPPMAYHNLPVGAQVLGRHDLVLLPDGNVVALPQGARGSQAPMFPPYSSTYAAQLPSQRSMYQLQNMEQSQSVIHTQNNHQYEHQLPGPPAVYQHQHQHQQMGPVPLFQDVFMQTATTTQPGSYNSASQGFDRGSVPLVQRHASAGTAPGNGVENQGYTNLRQNAQRIPHPDDNHRGRSNRGRRDFHSWNNNRGQRMQSYTAQNYGFRHVSVGNEFQGDSCSTSSLSFNGSNYQQNVPQVVHSDSSITSQFNPGTPARNDQQRQLVHENMARTNQQQMPVTPVSVTDTNARHAFEDGLIQATLALQLENAGTPNGPGMDDITPRRPIIDNTVSATAPPKLGHQTPMLRSRRGQSVMGLNGSPVRRPSQPLTIDPIRGPPPAFFPQNTQSVTATSAVSSPVRSVSEVQNQTPASQSRATSVSVRGEEPHTAQAIMFSPDQLVTPNNQQIVRTQVAQVALPPLQIAPYQMAPNQMAPNQVTPWQIAPYQMPPLPTGPASRHLSIIAPGGKKPSIEVACDPQNLPFVELLRRAQPSNSNGVVRISNIPYSTTQSEIVAFLGRNAAILEDKKEPVHVIMDRVSGKTMDAYIEFISMGDAVRAVDRQIEVHRDGNKGGRLGNRFVSVEVSGLDQMMRTLFPKATNVVWHGMVPEIIPADPDDRYNTGFKGFINPEELVLLVKQVQDPNRIHFSEKCPQRPFECMISTIVKYPWFMVDYITINDRDELFQAAFDIVKGLLNRMSEDDFVLNSRLLKRFTNVIFNCPGFTEAQKDDVAFVCNINPYTMNPPLAPMADHWHVLKTIGPKPHVAVDVLKYYIALIREATTSMDVVTLAQRSNTTGMPPFFGNMNIQYPPDVKYWTFAQVARIEWSVIDNLLRRSLQE